MSYFFLPALGCIKHTPGWPHIVLTIKKILLALMKYNKMEYLCILYQCKYSIKEYTTKIHLYFNMYCIILNLHNNKSYKSQNNCNIVKFSPKLHETAVDTKSIYFK